MNNEGAVHRVTRLRKVLDMELTSRRVLVSLAICIVLAQVSHAQLPGSWLDQDVGSVSVVGSASYSGGTFTVKGGGTIGGTSDGLHFMYLPLSGDGSIVARVVSLQGVTYPTAGVMIRESLNSNATDAFVFYQTNYGYLQTRATTGASASTQHGSFTSSTPYWLKLVRSGTSFTGYISTNGFDWVQAGTSTITMATNAYIGLAVANGSSSTVETATFDNVSVSSTAAPAPVITSISATTGAVGSQVEISGANFGTVQGGSAVLLNGSAVTINSWSETAITFTIPTGATSGLLLVSIAPSMNDSNAIYFTVEAQPLASGWLDQDVGTVSVVGSASYSGGTFTVKGGGTIGGTADGLHFMYLPLSGDGSIVARVVSLQGVTYPTAGVMIRESLNSNATDAFVFYQTNYGYLQTRATTGASASTQHGSFTSSTPYWLKLVRSGTSFTGYISTNGFDWVQAGTSTITMATNAYIGLAVANGSSSTVETATFDNVSVSSTAAPAPVITSISATTGAVGSQVEISGANFGFAQGGSAVLLNGSAVTIDTWTNSAITFTIPTGATSGLLLVSIAPSMNDSNAIYFTVEAQPLASGWLDQDVGTVSVVGSASYSGGTFTVKGGGTIGGTADGFHFVYQSLSGDGSIVARLVSLQGAASPQAGVMIRESLNANATNAFVYYTTNYGTLRTRTTTGGSASNQTVSFSASTPYWLKVVRSGTSFTGYISTNGFDWVQVATSTITMATNAYIGLAVANNSSSTVETATFDNVSVSSTAVPAPVITSISDTTGSVGSQVAISGANFGTAQGGSAVLLNGSAVTINSWSGTVITFTIPTGATSGPLLVSIAPSMNVSNAIYFTVEAQPLPSGWLDQDVGTVSVVGSASYSGGTFTVKGGGTIGGTADSMHFVYQPLTGDGSITARVLTRQGAAVVMIRETLMSNAVEAYVSYAPNQAYLIDRASTGASTTGPAGTSFSTSGSYWLRLVRSGSTFTGYASYNGFDWIQVGTATITMAQNAYIGLAAAGTGSSLTSTFDNVSINSTAVPAPVITGISATTASVGTQVQVTGANFGASQGGNLVTVNGVQAPIDLWSDSSIVFIVPSGATSGFVLVLQAPSLNDSNPVYLTVTFTTASQPLVRPRYRGSVRHRKCNIFRRNFHSHRGRTHWQHGRCDALCVSVAERGRFDYCESGYAAGKLSPGRPHDPGDLEPQFYRCICFLRTKSGLSGRSPDHGCEYQLDVDRVF